MKDCKPTVQNESPQIPKLNTTSEKDSCEICINLMEETKSDFPTRWLGLTTC